MRRTARFSRAINPLRDTPRGASAQRSPPGEGSSVATVVPLAHCPKCFYFQAGPVEDAIPHIVWNYS